VTAHLGWGGIARLGLVQAAIGAAVMISTSLLNRVMMVELALAASIPAGLVAWHYAVQLSRPLWGHGSDRGRRRTPWIVGGMGVLAIGTLMAVDAAVLIGGGSVAGHVLAIVAYALIGSGVGAAGTSLLALLAAGVAPERRAGAAALTWIMMVAGIAVSAGLVGSLIEPFSFARLALVTGAAVLTILLIALGAVHGVEKRVPAQPLSATDSFPDALRSIARDAAARRFTLFVFLSMLAYSMQDLILEPFGGFIFGLSPGATTQLSGVHHGGILAGMIVTGVLGSAFADRRAASLDRWIIAGCALSALALAGLMRGAADPSGWPLLLNLIVLGLGNGIFAAAAVGTMLMLASAGGDGRSGARMGVWGAAQAIAFGLGGLSGAVIVDLLRRALGSDSLAFQTAFACEAALFLVSAVVAMRMKRPAVPQRILVPPIRRIA
jgi:MFS transporter, BCD family, chlorophyll transporter